MSHSQQDRVRLAIVGCGTISQLNAPGYLEYDKCDVVALCDPVRQRAEGRAAEWGIAPKIYTRYEQVLEDPDIDAVELLTPTHMHAEQSIAALEAGKHVSCQKPVAATVEEAERVAEAAAGADTIFRVTENFLYYPPLVKAKELLDSGAIGEPSIVRMRVVLTDFESDSEGRSGSGTTPCPGGGTPRSTRAASSTMRGCTSMRPPCGGSGNPREYLPWSRGRTTSWSRPRV